LKLENFLIGANGDLKITDFGVSCQGRDKIRSTNCGTLTYFSPEQANGQEYNKMVDIWALGVLLYEFLVGKPPFESPKDDRLLADIRKNKLTFPTGVPVPDGGKILIRKILKTEPSQRLPLSQISNDAWVQLQTTGTQQL
jgi:serine/threonine protein kinase